MAITMTRPRHQTSHPMHGSFTAVTMQMRRPCDASLMRPQWCSEHEWMVQCGQTTGAFPGLFLKMMNITAPAEARDSLSQFPLSIDMK